MDSDEIWQSLRGSLGSYIRRRIKNPQDAEDVLQDVLLKTLKGIAALKDPTALAPWAYRIAQNAIADYYRSAKTADVLDPDIADPQAEAAEDLNRELAGCLAAMIDDLPEPYREAIVLVERDGMTQREYSARCGLSVSGAKARVQRARRKLKAKLLGCCRVELDRMGNILDYEHLDDVQRYCPK